MLAFFSPYAPDEIAVEELATITIGGHIIERTIEFSPEQYQAGGGMLSYFGQVLRQKDPTTKAKVRLEQDGNRVRLHIESPGGDIEIIEKELEQYALVITKQAPIDSLLENRIYTMQLESKLAMLQVELKSALDGKQLLEQVYSHQVRDLKAQVDNLTQLIATNLLQKGQVIELISKQAESHERMQAALLAHGQMLFKDLLQESRDNFQLQQAIQNLHHNLLSGLTTIDVEDQIKQALETVQKTKPGMLSRIYTQVESAALKASTSLGSAAKLIAPFLHH